MAIPSGHMFPPDNSGHPSVIFQHDHNMIDVYYTVQME